MLLNVLLGFALVVAVGGVAFAAGRATAPTTTTNGRFGGNGANGGGFAGGFGPNASGAPGRGGFGGAISIQGKVTSVAADSITIQLPSGQDVTIPTSGQTTYHSQTAATSSDVTTGANVEVQLSGGGRVFTGANGNGNGGQGNGNGNGGPTASGQPNRGFGAASSITVLPAGS